MGSFVSFIRRGNGDAGPGSRQETGRSSAGAAGSAADGAALAAPVAASPAAAAAAQDGYVQGCVFCEIIQRKRPAKVVMRVSSAC